MTDFLKQLTRSWKTWAAVAACGMALAFVLLAPSQPVEATLCDDGSGSHIDEGWASTPEAVARTLAGDCQVGYVCKEWCMLVCGEETGTGTFSCFPG